VAAASRRRARSAVGTLDTVPATFFVASVGPAVGAVAATWFAAGPTAVARWARRILRLRFGGFWWFAALGMPALYYLIGFFTAAFAAAAGPTRPPSAPPAKLPGLAWPLVALVWAATFGLGEEAGWRGWLLPVLAERVTVFWASVLVAAVWIVWHAPAFFFNRRIRRWAPASSAGCWPWCSDRSSCRG
jgi:membrane protease YdiL (CAAX protease family)